MITLRNLHKFYGEVCALKGISLEIQPGDKVVIQGPSGSGKTTLLRLIAGLELLDEGEILLDGGVASTPGWASPPYSRKIGMVFQRNALWPHLKVSQNILFAMNGLSKEEKAIRLEELIHWMEIDHLLRRFPAQLSGGEARRVALARAVAPLPRRLLLDEPFTSLDFSLKSRLLDLMLAFISKHQITTLYVTHDLDEACKAGGRLIILEKGELVA